MFLAQYTNQPSIIIDKWGTGLRIYAIVKESIPINMWLQSAVVGVNISTAIMYD